MTTALAIIAAMLLSAPTPPAPAEQAGKGPAVRKDKDRVVIVKDKSKPIRRELEAVFAERVRATRDGDGEALIALVHPDYSFVMPDGQEVGYEWITNYLRAGLEQFVEIREMTITAETIYPRQEGEVLVAVVEARQRFARMQRLGDGEVHEVFSTVLQDETWVRVTPASPATANSPATPARWQLRNVTNLREQTLTVDGEKVEQFAR